MAGLSYQRVLVDCDDSLKKYLSLEKVVPALIDRKAIPKKVGKAVMKKQDTELLLGWIKESSFDNFVALLDVLESLSEDEKHITLMKVMAASLAKMRPPPQSAKSNASEIIAKFVKTANAQPIHRQKFSVAPQFEQLTKLDVEPAEQTELPTSCSETPSEESTSPNKPTPPQLTTSSDYPSESSKLEEPVIPPQSELQSAPELQAKTSTSVHRLHATPDITGQPPIRPPSGYIGCKTQYFTKEGGLLYCPTHGVTIDIPPEAVPPTVDCFSLGVYMYLQGPFRIPSDVEHCTPVVWFHLYPQFKFKSDVTVKIPHSTLFESGAEFCLLRASEPLQGPIFELTETLEANFSDGYHIVAKVRHFSPYVGGRRRKLNRHSSTDRSSAHKKNSPSHCKHSPKHKSKKVQQFRYTRSTSRGSSLESQSSVEDPSCPEHDSQLSTSASDHLVSPLEVADHEQQPTTDDRPGDSVKQQPPTSNDEPLGTNEFCVALCVPRDRSSQMWEATFFICYFHPTGVMAIQQAAVERAAGTECDLTSPRRFQFVNDFLEFQPPQWEEDGWRVFATETNQLEKNDVMLFSVQEVKQLAAFGLYPPRLTYAVQALQYPPARPLQCEIEIVGARARGQRNLVYTLTSTAPCKDKSCPRVITTCPSLYSEDSMVCQALCGSGSVTDISFDLQNTDHQKLLADVSLQLSDSQKLGQLLNVDEYQIERAVATHDGDPAEQVYHILTTWATRNSPYATLTKLQAALEHLGIHRLKLHTTAVDDSLSSLPDTRLSDHSWFVLEMAKKLRCRWKFVGRLMGVPELDVQEAAYANRGDLSEQSYQMLQKWLSLTGHGATYDVLFKAVYRVFQHDSPNVNDALVYARKFTSMASTRYLYQL